MWAWLGIHAPGSPQSQAGTTSPSCRSSLDSSNDDERQKTGRQKQCWLKHDKTKRLCFPHLTYLPVKPCSSARSRSRCVVCVWHSPPPPLICLIHSLHCNHGVAGLPRCCCWVSLGCVHERERARTVIDIEKKCLADVGCLPPLMRQLSMHDLTMDAGSRLWLSMPVKIPRTMNHGPSFLPLSRPPLSSSLPPPCCNRSLS